MRLELRSFVDYSACGINLISSEGVHSFSVGHGVPDQVSRQELPEPIAEALRSGEPCHRRTPEQMRSSGDSPTMVAAGIQSVVNVPFRTGTLAMNSTQPETFSDDDIAVLCQFAAVIGEGHRRLEDLQALSAKERQLQQAQNMEAIGQLTAGVAHNFNNMLQAITGNLDLAQMEATAPVRELIGNALETSYRAAQMVQQLMVYSRQNPLPARFEVVDPALVIGDVEAVCRRTFNRRISFEVGIEPNLPSVFANSIQLKQMLLNLCINSRDAMEGGSDEP